MSTLTRAEVQRVSSLVGLNYPSTVVLGKLREALKTSGLSQKERESVVTVLLALEAGRSMRVEP